MTMPPDDAMTKSYSAHRLEVFTGRGRRRTWTGEEKAQIVGESYSGEAVSAVARRHGLAATQLFTWRRDARGRLPEAGVMFAPVKLIDPPPEPAEGPKTSAVRRKAKPNKAGRIELEIDDVAIRVERGAEARTVAAIIRALKADR